MSDILFIDGQIVFDGGSIVFTSDPSSCECCGTGYPPATCVGCPDGAPGAFSVTISGSGCIPNGTYILTFDSVLVSSDSQCKYLYVFPTPIPTPDGSSNAFDYLQLNVKKTPYTVASIQQILVFLHSTGSLGNLFVTNYVINGTVNRLCTDYSGQVMPKGSSDNSVAFFGCVMPATITVSSL